MTEMCTPPAGILRDARRRARERRIVEKHEEPHPAPRDAGERPAVTDANEVEADLPRRRQALALPLRSFPLAGGGARVCRQPIQGRRPERDGAPIARAGTVVPSEATAPEVYTDASRRSFSGSVRGLSVVADRRFGERQPRRGSAPGSGAPRRGASLLGPGSRLRCRTSGWRARGDGIRRLPRPPVRSLKRCPQLRRHGGASRCRGVSRSPSGSRRAPPAPSSRSWVQAGLPTPPLKVDQAWLPCLLEPRRARAWVVAVRPRGRRRRALQGATEGEPVLRRLGRFLRPGSSPRAASPRGAPRSARRSLRQRREMLPRIVAHPLRGGQPG
jgi:hypothetical protein